MASQEERREALEKQGYRIVGNHSVVKVCHWTRQALRGRKHNSRGAVGSMCYKYVFYGINSHRCIQMSPVLDFCNLQCHWCWRDVDYVDRNFVGKMDDPKDIVDGIVKEHVELLQGFKGSNNVNPKRLKEIEQPAHVAISLTGEVTFYPKLPELVEEIHSRGMTSFIVSNGTRPDMVRKLLDKQPTQFYMTLPAPNEEIFKKSCHPIDKDLWPKILETLDLLKEFKRSVVRLTLVKNLNMVNPNEFAELLNRGKPNFIEAKSAMPIGCANKRMVYGQMSSHEEIVDFSKQILADLEGYRLASVFKPSRVALMTNDKIPMQIDFESYDLTNLEKPNMEDYFPEAEGEIEEEPGYE